MIAKQLDCLLHLKYHHRIDNVQYARPSRVTVSSKLRKICWAFAKIFCLADVDWHCQRGESSQIGCHVDCRHYESVSKTYNDISPTSSVDLVPSCTTVSFHVGARHAPADFHSISSIPFLVFFSPLLPTRITDINDDEEDDNDVITKTHTTLFALSCIALYSIFLMGKILQYTPLLKR